MNRKLIRTTLAEVKGREPHHPKERAEGASPRTMERYTLNHLGALYGWEATPGDTGVDRLSHRTPIEGLFLSGHWTRPGGGLVPVMVSGMQTAQIVLGDSSVREVVESLGERA